MRSVVNSCFVAFVLPSNGLTLAIYYTCQMKPLDGETYGTKNSYFLASPPPISLDIYSALYFYLCISVDTTIKFLLNFEEKIRFDLIRMISMFGQVLGEIQFLRLAVIALPEIIQRRNDVIDFRYNRVNLCCK